MDTIRATSQDSRKAQYSLDLATRASSKTAKRQSSGSSAALNKKWAHLASFLPIASNSKNREEMMIEGFQNWKIWTYEENKSKKRLPKI